MLKWLAWLIYDRPLEVWMAVEYLNAKPEGVFLVFPDGTKILRKEWHPISDQRHFDRVYRKAEYERCPWCPWEDFADKKGFLARLKAWVRGPYIVD